MSIFYSYLSGVMLAVESVVDNLKKMSKPVTTPEEIAQVICYFIHPNPFPFHFVLYIYLFFHSLLQEMNLINTSFAAGSTFLSSFVI